MTLKRSFREKERGEFWISIRHKRLTVMMKQTVYKEFPPPSSFPFSLDWFYATAVSRESAGLALFFNKIVS